MNLVGYGLHGSRSAADDAHVLVRSDFQARKGAGSPGRVRSSSTTGVARFHDKFRRTASTARPAHRKKPTSSPALWGQWAKLPARPSGPRSRRPRPSAPVMKACPGVAVLAPWCHGRGCGELRDHRHGRVLSAGRGFARPSQPPGRTRQFPPRSRAPRNHPMRRRRSWG